MKIYIHPFFLIFLFLFSCSNFDNNETITIPFTIKNNRILLNAVVNGQEGQFIFDSGIVNSTVGVSATGLLPIGYTKRFINNKTQIVFVYSLNKIKFGNIEVKASSQIINRSENLTYYKEFENCDGLLGMRTFEGYWVELSFSRQQIVLYKNKPENYTNHRPLKTLSKYDAFYLPINIDAKEYLMNIDTGLQYSFLFPTDTINYTQQANIREIISIEEVNDYYLVKTNIINILDETFENVSIMTNSYSAQRRNFASHNDMGLIGISFLKNYDILFDYTNLRKGETSGMYYKPIVPSVERNYGFFSFMTKVPELGILNFNITEKGLLIISILKDSLAYTLYGLRPGDTIIKIDNKLANDFSKEDLLEPSFHENIKNITVLNSENEERIVFSNNY